MILQADRVYVYSVDVEGSEAPFERYRDLASQALRRLELSLPAAGTVVINPNVTIKATPDSRITTHPGFVAGILDALLDKGVAPERLLVGEGYGEDDRAEWAALSGYTAALQPFGMELVDLDRAGGVDVEIPDGVVFERLTFARQVTDCAYYVNAPVAKCHNLSCTTLAMKNTQGTVLSPQRHMCSVQQEDRDSGENLGEVTARGISRHEERFCHKQSDKTIARLQLGIPQLCIVDGLIGRDGTGFHEGDNRPLGWTLIGAGEVDVDTVGTYLMGLDPQAVPYLQVAAERGLGTNRIDAIEVIDLATDERLTADDLSDLRADPPMMPLSRDADGYFARFQEDGSLVPWDLDRHARVPGQIS